MPLSDEQWSKFQDMMHWLSVAKQNFDDEDQETIQNVINECADILIQLQSTNGGE